MSNKKQTAVEWLYKELALNNNSIDSIKERIYKESEIWKQAKEMEKEQIIDSVNFGQNNYTDTTIEDKEIAEQYYNETFNNE
jgi:hypothetical protein